MSTPKVIKDTLEKLGRSKDDSPKGQPTRKFIVRRGGKLVEISKAERETR